MERCIAEAKKLISYQVESNRISLVETGFHGYRKPYFWSNENVAGTLGLGGFFEGKDALTVLASGDQAFNLITKGIINVDTFDVNKLAEYFVFGLKKAMILKYSYIEFTDITFKLSCSGNPKLANQIISDTLPFMEEKYKIFWATLLDYTYRLQKEYGTQLSLIYLMCTNVGCKTDITKNNIYLYNEYYYNLLKSRLGNVNMSHKYGDAIDLKSYFDRQYDFILLSNILDYFDVYWGLNWTYDELLKYEQSIEPLLKQGGVLFLSYFFEWSRTLYEEIIEGSKITVDSLKNEEIYKVRSNYFYVTDYDGVILKRKI